MNPGPLGLEKICSNRREDPHRLISFRQIDPRLETFRTGDIALSCRDDVAGIFIMFFTRSLVEHSAIACWVDREKWEKAGQVIFKSYNEDDDLLMFVHITKRRMFDYYTQAKRSGLVLCSLDEFVRDNLITVWRRALSPQIKDKTALHCFQEYLEARALELEYENDIRTILGVPANIVYAPHENRKICTAMVCDYLSKSYGYPFLISRDGNLTQDDDLEPREVNFILPTESIGAIMQLCEDRRGVFIKTEYLSPERAILTYELPLAEVVMDFFDRLKSVSRGYASLDYEFLEFRAADVVKLDLLINGERVDALSVMVHRSVSQYRGREVVAKMRGLIPRQMFDVAIQAAIGAQIIARESVKALRRLIEGFGPAQSGKFFNYDGREYAW